MASRFKIVVFGPGPKFKGGLANYTRSLALAFDKMDGIDVHWVSWTQQYPAIIPRDFIDKATKSNKLDGSNVTLHYITNYNNPFTWQGTVNLITKINPDIVVFQWSIAVQGLPLSYIAKNLRKRTDAEIIFDLHFVIQKEESNLDRKFSKMALKHADSFVVHANKTIDELQTLFPNLTFEVTESGHRNLSTGKTPVIKLFHPVYDIFKPKPDFDVEAFKAKHHLKKYTFLFFGFIRKYKGLHNCIEAFAKLAKQRNDVSLLIVGESFWNTIDKSKAGNKLKMGLFKTLKSVFLKKKDNEENYQPLSLIDELNIKDEVMLVNTFVADEDVYQYFQVADATLLFYEYATPSGVESMAYNFRVPMLATKVGHFPETITDGYNGYLAHPTNTTDMAEIMQRAITNPINRTNIDETAAKMSWAAYAKAIAIDLI